MGVSNPGWNYRFSLIFSMFIMKLVTKAKFPWCLKPSWRIQAISTSFIRSERMTIENISWSISVKKWCQTRVLNQQWHDYQSDIQLTELQDQAKHTCNQTWPSELKCRTSCLCTSIPTIDVVRFCVHTGWSGIDFLILPLASIIQSTLFIRTFDLMTKLFTIIWMRRILTSRWN